jgi:hypothetical protein
MNADELLAFLCDDETQETATQISDWIRESKRFLAFVDANRAKIRKKLRTATTLESLRSVLLELEVARHFVEDRRCALEYERYGQGRGRYPDLTLTFRTHTVVHLEVTQIKEPGAETAEREGKLISLVCHKLGQMMPQSVNLLIVAAEDGSLTIEEVNRAMKRLKERIERREADLLSRFGFDAPADFFKQFQWLSGIVIWKSEKQERGKGKDLWTNPQTRCVFPAAVAALLKSPFPVSAANESGKGDLGG